MIKKDDDIRAIVPPDGFEDDGIMRLTYPSYVGTIILTINREGNIDIRKEGSKNGIKFNINLLDTDKDTPVVDKSGTFTLETTDEVTIEGWSCYYKLWALPCSIVFALVVSSPGVFSHSCVHTHFTDIRQSDTILIVRINIEESSKYKRIQWTIIKSG